METTLLGIAMPKVLKQLKDMLLYEGFMVQTIPTADPVIIASKEAGWMRSPRQLILELISENNHLTRINITAIINNNKNRHNAEEILEENFASKLYNVFKKVIKKPYGI